MGKQENDALDDGASVEERAANGEHMDEDEGTLFPAGSLAGDAVTPQSLVKRGLATQVTVSLSRAEVPTKSGLVDPNKSGRVMVSYAPGKVEHVPERDDDDKIVGWKLRQHLRATYVTDANDDAEVVRECFGQVVALDVRAAAELHAELGKVLEAELSTA